MTPEDKLILETTAIGPSTLMCPLPFCPYMVEIPEIPVSDDVAAVFGLSGKTLARMHAEHICAEKAEVMRAHLAGHKPEEWLSIIRLMRSLVDNTAPLAQVQQ